MKARFDFKCCESRKEEMVSDLDGMSEEWMKEILGKVSPVTIGLMRRTLNGLNRPGYMPDFSSTVS